MRRLALLLAVALGLSAGCAEAAGLQEISVPAKGESPAITGVVWTPCAEPAGEVKLGTATLQATANCPILGDKLPLVIISHGYGGNALGHRDTAQALVEAGFVVVAISHPIDSGRGDMARADTLSVLVERPADIKRSIDFMLGAWQGRDKLDPSRIGFFGFSRGGYTGLVVAGGNPDIRKAGAFCDVPFPKPSCDEVKRGSLPSEAPPHDPRVKAAVLADPGSAPLFDREALKRVTIPIELWVSEHSDKDNTGAEVRPDWVMAIAEELPAKPEYHLVKNAGHFAFLPPCSPQMAKSLPRLCTDREGFDRKAFHDELNAATVAFLRTHLVDQR